MQSARTSKITNDGLTRSGIGCFTGVPIYDNSGRQRAANQTKSTSEICLFNKI